MTDERSIAERMAQLPEAQRQQIIDGLTLEQQQALLYEWAVWRRAKQTTPQGDWRKWLILAGRGFGKTRTGAEFIREQVMTGSAQFIALVGATAADVRDTMIEGQSGILSVFPPGQRPQYEPSKRRVTFHNGAVATAYSADEPDRLRGPNHDTAWADELAAWRYADAWDQLTLGLRIGQHPRVVVTTTPRPVPVIKQLVETKDGSVVVTRGSTFENISNLAPSFVSEMMRRYEGTTLGRQELHAEILDDVDGALWHRGPLDALRVHKAPALKRVVVAVDPAATNNASSNETGIVVAGVSSDGVGYVLDDRTIKGSPNEWGVAALAAFHQYQADRIVAEANQGGDMVAHTLRTVDKNAPIKLVRASRGKRTRAEPIAAMYEQGRVRHVGFLTQLEDQMCGWVPDVSQSPDRVDALVWALTELMIEGNRQAPPVVPISLVQSSPWNLS